jgi:hypothetical protein
LGIGDWAQSPIPNPQSPSPIPNIIYYKLNIKNNRDIMFKILINKEQKLFDNLININTKIQEKIGIK